MSPVAGAAPTGLPPAAANPQRLWLANLVIGNLLLLVLVLVLGLVALNGSRQAHRQRALEATANLARSLQQAVASEVARVDLALQGVAQAWAHQGRAALPGGEPLAQVLDDWIRLVPGLLSVSLSDASGRALAHSQAVGEPGCPVLSATGDGLHIDGPMQATPGGPWSLLLSRRLPADATSPSPGIVCAHLDVQSFQRLFGAVQLGVQGAISLRTTSLRLVARHGGGGGGAPPIGSDKVSPELKAALAHRPRGGHYLAATAIDQIERANAYAQVGDLPLVVIVGLATDDYLADWQTEALLIAGLAGLFTMTLMGGSALLFLAWRRDRASQLALIHEGDRYRALLRTASDGIHVIDRQGRLLEWSDSFAGMLGRKPGEVQGLSVFDWDEGRHNDSVRRTLATFQVGDQHQLTTRFRQPDGSLMDVEVVSRGVRFGQQDLMFCSARDISRRVRSERALRASQAFLDRTGRIAAVGGWELNLATRVATWSAQACRIHGLDETATHQLADVLALYDATARARLQAAMDHSERSGAPWELELPLKTLDGRALWVRFVGEIDTHAGSPGALVGAVQDVTESHQRRLDLQREQVLRTQSEQHAQALDQLLKERSDMLDVLAHEVRQPLNNASAVLQSAAIDLAQAGDLSASGRLQRARNVMGHVLANIDNTLAVAALLAHAEPIAREDTDVDTLLAVAIADLPVEHRSRCQVERLTGTRTASMDMGLMRLAVRNLLANALRHSPPDAPVLLRVSDSDEPLALIIDVVDRGAGIDAALLPRLFQRGSRGRQGDHGVGLYIVRRVMELHGGAAELFSTSPQGTTMRLVLSQSSG